MSAKNVSAIYLAITHIISLVALILYLLGSLVAVTMSFDAGVHVSTIVMDIILVVVPIVVIILPAVFSWRSWKRNNMAWANSLTIINWVALIAVIILLFG